MPYTVLWSYRKKWNRKYKQLTLRRVEKSIRVHWSWGSLVLRWNLKSKHVNVGEARIIIYWWSPSESTGGESSPPELLEVWKRIPEFFWRRAGVCTQAKEQDPCERSTHMWICFVLQAMKRSKSAATSMEFQKFLNLTSFRRVSSPKTNQSQFSIYKYIIKRKGFED